jgi:hypothetical protein
MVAQLENCSVRRLAHAFLDNQLKRYFSLRKNYEKLLKLQAHAERRQAPQDFFARISHIKLGI